MPLNMTITLDDRSEIPLHPLDLSTSSQTAGSYCMAMIQSSSPFSTPGFMLPDLVLGVPFLRSTYMVMAYEHPSENGSFTSQDTYEEAGEQVNPQLGLLALTNITQAMLEFNQTRLNSASGGTKHQSSSSHAKKLPIGIDILLGCIGFLVLCGLIFGARWLYNRRTWRKTSTDSFEADNKNGVPDLMRYTLARHNSTSDRYSMAESAKSQSRRPAPLSNLPSQGTDRSSFTHVGSGSDGDEFGFRKTAHGARTSVSSWDSFYADSTLGGGGPYPPMQRHSYTRAALDSPPGSPGLPGHERGGSESSLPGEVVSPESTHRRLNSEDALAVPLLAHTRTPSGGEASYSEDIADVPPHHRARSPPSRRPANERMSSFTLADWEAQQGHESGWRESGEMLRRERAVRPSLLEGEPVQQSHHHRHGSNEQSARRANDAEHDRTLPPIPVGEPLMNTSNLGT